MSIQYIKGDATNPIGNNTKIIVHICNDIGGWGKGFVLAISNRWQAPEKEYRNWFKNNTGQLSDTVKFQKLKDTAPDTIEKEFKLGNVQFVKVSSDLWIANMVAQHKVRKNKDGTPPIRYPFVAECIQRVAEFAKIENATVHMPRIGCGLAGGKWEEIEAIINKKLIANKIDTTVYDFA